MSGRFSPVAFGPMRVATPVAGRALNVARANTGNRVSMTLSPNRDQPYPPASDFGQRMALDNADQALALALRERAAHTSAREAMNFHLVMGIVGFAGGLMVVVPLVLWLAANRPDGVRPVAPNEATRLSDSSSGASPAPALVSAPVLVPAGHTPAGSGPAHVAAAATAGPGEKHDAALSAAPAMAADPLVRARQLTRTGDILGARHLLEAPALADDAQATFALAETFDPNVLAALGIEAHLADAPMARRLYRAARGRGIAAAANRLRALE